MTPSFIPQNMSQIELKLHGKARDHDRVDDLNNLNLVFRPAVFDDGLIAQNDEAFVHFRDNVDAFVVTGFKESVANDGSMAGHAIVRIPGARLRENLNTADFRLTTIPIGYSVSYGRLNATDLKIELNGRNRAVTDVIHSFDLDLDFVNVANIFTNPVTPRPLKIPVDYTETPKFNMSQRVLPEAQTNDGSIATKVTFAITNGDKIIADQLDNVNNLATALNLPYDLKASFKALNVSQIEMSLEGRAVAHRDDDDIDGIGIRFDGGLFVRGVQPPDITNLSINFINAPATTTQGSFV